MTLRPIPVGSTIDDFNIECANPATVDLDGRTAEQLVGRRLSKLYPSAPASGILAACIQAWHSASRRVHIVPARSPDRSPARADP